MTDQYYDRLEKDYHMLHTVLLNISKYRQMEEVSKALATSALQAVRNPRITAEECREAMEGFYQDNVPEDRSNGGWGG